MNCNARPRLSQPRPPGSGFNPREKGSALLIVFVFAAMVAIMLYMEMPVALFEARRQKEQLLIDRGDEYKPAVKLFVRKVGMYPASIDALENTNRMRFLRHKFTDPFTGKDDWRLLHAGPGGIIIDSKVNPIRATNPMGGNAPNGTGSSFGSNPGFNSTNANSANSGFASSTSNPNNPGNSGFGSTSSSTFGSSSNEPAVVVPPIPKRGAAVAANGAATTEQPGSEPDADQNRADPNALPPLPEPGQPNQNAANAQTAEPVPQSLSAAEAANGQPAAPNGSPQAVPGAEPSNPMQTVRNLLANPNSQGQQGVTAGSPMGVVNSGGIAGIASKAKGLSIKTVNDQTDYSLWEFYYDPRKDNPGVAGAVPAGIQGAVPGTAPTNNGTAGQNPSSSVFPNSPPTTAQPINPPSTNPPQPTNPPSTNPPQQ